MAGLLLVSDLPFRQLAPFAVPAMGHPSSGASRPARFDDATRVYAGSGWVGGVLRQVESWRGSEGYLLRVEGAGDFAVLADGGEIRCLRPRADEPLDVPAESALLGPCLVLSLALRGIWCLHASAVASEGSVMALVGESGCGKSTLAAALADSGGMRRRVCDDLLPVRPDRGGARALPRYPQAGLAGLGRQLAAEPTELSLTAAYLLQPGADAVEVVVLSRRDAALALVRQTMAARLFDPELQGRHLAACAELARAVPISRLSFPRRLDALQPMIAALCQS